MSSERERERERETLNAAQKEGLCILDKEATALQSLRVGEPRLESVQTERKTDMAVIEKLASRKWAMLSKTQQTDMGVGGSRRDARKEVRTTGLLDS